MSVLEFCRWVQYSAPLVAMRSSPWLFPVIATIHLMGLALIGGAVLVVDLRLLWLGLRSQPVAGLARDAERWLLRGLLVIVFTLSVRRRVAMANEADVSPVRSKLVALVSLSLWTIVAVGGRYIGFP